MNKPLCDTHEDLWNSLVADNMIPFYDDVDLALNLSCKIQAHTVSIAEHERRIKNLEDYHLKRMKENYDEVERLKKELHDCQMDKAKIATRVYLDAKEEGVVEGERRAKEIIQRALSEHFKRLKWNECIIGFDQHYEMLIEELGLDEGGAE